MEKVSYAAFGALVMGLLLGWLAFSASAQANFCSGQLNIIGAMQRAQAQQAQEAPAKK